MYTYDLSDQTGGALTIKHRGDFVSVICTSLTSAVMVGPLRTATLRAVLEDPSDDAPRDGGVVGARPPFDSGGVLPPGLTTVSNSSGKPEAIFTNDQWQVRANEMERAAGTAEDDMVILRNEVAIAQDRAEKAERSANEIAIALSSAIDRAEKAEQERDSWETIAQQTANSIDALRAAEAEERGAARAMAVLWKETAREHVRRARTAQSYAEAMTGAVDQVKTHADHLADESRDEIARLTRERDEWEANAQEAERERAVTAQDRDELISVQTQIVKHPAFKPCFDGDGKLLPRMLDRLDGLMEAEQRKSPALEHSATAPHVTVMRDRDPNYLSIRVDHPTFGKYGVREHIPNTRDDVAKDMWVSFSSEEVLIEHPLIGRHARPLDIPISDEMVRRFWNAFEGNEEALEDMHPHNVDEVRTSLAAAFAEPPARSPEAEKFDPIIDAAIRGHSDITSPAAVHAIADALAKEGARAPEAEA